MSRTKISWSEFSWNPVVGCSKVSTGCQNCYAEKMAFRLNYMGNDNYFDVLNDSGWNGKTICIESALEKPLHWKKPRKIFVCSMGDLFHPSVPFEFIDKVFATTILCPQHTFQYLTKRPKRMAEYFATIDIRTLTIDHWSFPNIWLGVSAENQECADERIPILLQIPAAVRFVSIEPMLERIDLMQWLKTGKLNWIICGAESGPKRRKCKLEWVRDLVGQCRVADVPVFVKQLSINGKVSHNPEEWPEDLRIRQYPDLMR